MIRRIRGAPTTTRTIITTRPTRTGASRIRFPTGLPAPVATSWAQTTGTSTIRAKTESTLNLNNFLDFGVFIF